MPLFLAPAWFKDTYIGIEVEQLIGIGALVVVAGVVHLLASQALRLYLRARLSVQDREFWDQERSRLRRALLSLTIAITVLLGFPTLGFDPSVENVVNQVASLFGAVALVLLGFRGIDIFTNVWKRAGGEDREPHRRPDRPARQQESEGGGVAHRRPVRAGEPGCERDLAGGGAGAGRARDCIGRAGHDPATCWGASPSSPTGPTRWATGSC